MTQRLHLPTAPLIILISSLSLGCPSGGGGSTSDDTTLDTATVDAGQDTSPSTDVAQVTDGAALDTGASDDASLAEDVLNPEDTAVEDSTGPSDASLQDTMSDTKAPMPDAEVNPDTIDDAASLPDACVSAVPKAPIELTAGTSVLSVTYDNQGVDSEREVVIQAPSPLPNKPLPVLFFFHGSGGGTNGTINQCKKIQQAGKEIICIAPQGEAQIESGKPGWNLGSGQTAEDDLTFVRTLWNAIKDDVHVDKAHIFAGGSSMGGAFTANVLSVSPCTDFLAGHAHIASTMWKDTVIESKGLQSVAIIHGEEDGLIPIDGGPAFGGTLNFLSVEEALGTWAAHNGCDVEGEPVVEKEDLVTRISYPSCPVPLVVYRLVGKGHNANAEEWYGANNFALLYEIFVNQTIP